MTKSIQQVRQNLEILQSQVGETAAELKELHLNYLEILSQSLKQQFILGLAIKFVLISIPNHSSIYLSTKSNASSRILDG